MNRLKPPKQLILDAIILQNWKLCKEDFVLFMTTTEYDKKPGNVKSSFPCKKINQY